MRRLLLLAALAAPAAAAPAASAATAVKADVPSARTLYQDGPTGRYLMDGTWLVRKDLSDHGLSRHLERSTSTAGWTPTTVPSVWNATGDDQRSFIGGPVWYRKDFRLPSSAAGLDWIVRFESVNYRAQVWLNGRPIGSHAGAYLPFELRLGAGLRRGGVNHLVLRVDNRRFPWDFPPSRYTNDEEPAGGWWNYGGLNREVYLRRVDRVDLDNVAVRPSFTTVAGPATISFRAGVTNLSGHPQRVRVAATFGGQPVSLGTVKVAGGAHRTVQGRLTLATPHVWWPSDPYLYDVRIDASIGAARVAAWTLHTGVRTVRVSSDGHLLLNNVPVNLRGAAVHEDLPGKGNALDNADRQELVNEIKAVGATLVRVHYPMHPEFEELADREGLLLWSEVPVYRMLSDYLAPKSIRDQAVDLVRQNVRNNVNHPSVIVWSIGNELQDTMPSAVRTYIAAAARVARGLDSSRPVGIAMEGHPRTTCAAGLGPVQVIGLNDYFGWYSGQVANKDDLSPYLDAMRACHPTQAMLVTEFGAEANRDGPADEPGTYAFQQDFIRYHLGVFATKPYLSGAIYWALREFKVRPGWAGGNPVPSPPYSLHQKGVITYDGRFKPAYADLQAGFQAVDQIPGEPLPPPAP